MQRPGSFIPPLSWKIKSGPKESTLAAWRGINLREQEKALKNNARAVSDLIPDVLKGLGLDRKRTELEIVKVWTHLMDPLVVAHAQPAGIFKGTLFINVDSNTWLSELVRYRRREILQRLQYSFGAEMIQRLSFRVG
jgi:hypothetical protein